MPAPPRLAACATVIVALAAATAADPPKPAAKPLTAEQQQKLKEAQRYSDMATELEKTGKLAESVAAAEKMLAIERAVLGDIHEDVAGSLNRIGRTQRKREEWASARTAYRELAAVRAKLYGPEDWRTGDARRAADDVDREAAMTPADRGRLRDAAALDGRRSELHRQGKYAEAVEPAGRVLAARRELLGDAHPDTAESLNRLANLYRAQGRYADADPLLRDALAARRKALGDAHPDTALSLNNLAVLYQDQGRYADAEPLYKDALAARRKALGDAHPDTAESLNRLANLYRAQGRYADADPPKPAAKPLTAEQQDKVKERNRLANEAVELQKAGKLAEAAAANEKGLALSREVYGPNHAAAATFLDRIGRARFKQEAWAAARAAYRELVAVRAALYGSDHWQTTDARTALADVDRYEKLTPNDRAALGRAVGRDAAGVASHARGEYRDAVTAYQDALDVRKRILGPDHLSTITSLDNLALLYRTQGRYADAEPLFKDALAARRKALGDAHPDTAVCMNHLAGLYSAQGRYADAEPLFKDALAARRKALEKDHPDTLYSMNDLAALYRALGRNAEAEPLYKDALAARRKVLGDAHPSTAASLNNLANLYRDQGRYADAERLLKEALAANRKALGDAHPDTARSLNNLANLYYTQGRYADAEPMYKDALAARRKALGDAHPSTATSLDNLANLYRAQGRYADAEPLTRAALDATADHLDATAAVQSEAAQLAHVAVSRWHFDTFLTCTVKGDPAAAYAGVLRWQGAITARQAFARAARQTDPAAKSALADLTAVTRQLAALSGNPSSTEQKVDVAARLKELGEKRDALEAKLAARSAAFDRYVKNRSLTPADLRKALPADTALIDYVEYGSKLAAFIVGKDGIARVELGDAKPVAAAVDAFRQTMSRSRPTTGQPGDPGVALRELVWRPMAKHLAGATTVLVCPDGPLCRVPFAALPGSDPDKYLIEEVALAVVPVPRMLPDLLADRGPKKDNPPTLLAVGDVDFDAGPGAGPTQVASAAGGWKRKRAGGPRAWDRLPGTAGEVSELADSFRTAVPGGKLTVLRAVEPTEAAVRDHLGRHEYLHLATHGFFADPADAPKPSTRSGPAADTPPSPAANSGLLSGLVLAGANKPKGDDDGVLTALEVGDLDLSRVELAVLSACETGLGQTAGGEGVLGLQRAFQVAGARTTVTSLWKVDDQATRTLMGRFYDGFWKQNLGCLEALRAAQLDMLANGKSRGLVREAEPAADAKPGRTPPFYWAAFTLAGDWR